LETVILLVISKDYFNTYAKLPADINNPGTGFGSNGLVLRVTPDALIGMLRVSLVYDFSQAE